MTLASIIDDVTGSARTLTVYNHRNPDALDAIERHFSVQNVEVEQADVPDAPHSFAVLHDDGEFLAASGVEDLRAAVSFETGLVENTDFEALDRPDVLEHVSDTTFSDYGKRRMILASREIEERAWRAGGGELRAGFQHLSLLRDQWDVYAKLADQGVEVHVYGAPDWEPPKTERITVHESDAPEMRDAWFVAFESSDATDCALVADEREPNAFEGFWSYDEEIVADVFDYLRTEY
ncbi:DICT sensory domain-containing protein [Halorussus amylolyticus]|uniref:DICT sensory domain-containing protein n=1 Tax=Halorussus amylolyticus TaxID=1126242 RepID=UPI0010455696|nr:DICT sensory domain-containing protein [Halorussus amylolyticus]